MPFRDRSEAGRLLAARLMKYREESPVVLGLPRGGIPVAYEVARALGAPLDVWVVRKVGAPDQPELGLGAVAEGGTLFLDRSLVRRLGYSETEILQQAEARAEEVVQRVARFRGPHPPPELQGRTVVLVDDGIATGGTMRAALWALREKHPRKVVLAVPVAAVDSLESLSAEADEVECVEPADFMVAVGAYYEDFQQTTDEEVARLLALAREEQEARWGAGPVAPGPLGV
jgi:putative phosphoribosyl transferase